MEFSRQMHQDILVIDLKGRLDMSNSDILKEEFPSWLQSAGKLVFSCKDLEFLDSTGLGVLLLCLKEAMKSKGDIRLAEVNETVRMVLEITRADEIFQVFPTVEEAVASFS